MGSCISANNITPSGGGAEHKERVGSKSPAAPQSQQSAQSPSVASAASPQSFSSPAPKPTDIALELTKHYERYSNRQFGVSVCCAQGVQTTMDDGHCCQFRFSKHPQYSLFGMFDGHNGAKASNYLADNLYNTLNELQDLENNEEIISSINEMDKTFILNESENSGSTIVFAIISSNIKQNHPLSLDNLTPATTAPTAPTAPTAQTSEVSEPTQPTEPSEPSESNGGNVMDGFDIEYNGRIFWCGDSRGVLIRRSAVEDPESLRSVPEYDILTTQHSLKNKDELLRVESMNGEVVYGRIHGLLCVTRSFGDGRMKYDGSVVTADCEYEGFEAKTGDILLLCTDELSEKWSDNEFIEKVTRHLNSEPNDTAKAIGNIVDDAICNGSDDNLSAMLIQFGDGTKQDFDLA